MSVQLRSTSTSDLSHLSESEVDDILLPIPSSPSLRSDTIMSIPSDQTLSTDTSSSISVRSEEAQCQPGAATTEDLGQEMYIMASKIRSSIPKTSTPAEGSISWGGSGEELGSGGGHHELDTKELMFQLEALAMTGPSATATADSVPATAVAGSLTKEMGTKVKGFFQDLTSNWKFPTLLDDEDDDDDDDEEEGEGTEATSEKWDFGKVESGVTSFLSTAIAKGTKWIESSAADLASSIFRAEDEDSVPLEEVELDPIEDFYEYNDYKIRTKGFGSLTLQSIKVPENESKESALILTFKIVVNPSLKVERSVGDGSKSVLLQYGTDEVEITLPEGMDPTRLHMNEPDSDNGSLVLEAF